jgi:hypothetical protein
MAITVSDARSNPNDQIAHAAKVLGRSPQRRAVFGAIHRGKARIKSVSEIQASTELPRKRVLEEAVKLVKQHIVTQTTKNGEIAYERDEFFSAQRDRILKLASNAADLKKFPTKYNQGVRSPILTIKVPRQLINTAYLTIDSIASFEKAWPISPPTEPLALPERTFKSGLLNVLRQRGTFNDWGGEQNDIYSTNLRVKVGGQRLRAAFGLKGPGARGKLTPKKMGKNGDQIQRLFQSSAEVFIVQYWGDVDQSVVAQMTEFAKAKSVSEGCKIWYGVIDGADSDRLALAYPTAFGLKKSKRR